MDLRPRKRQHFSGFTKAEIERMEQLLKESRDQLLDKMFCKKLARAFSTSKDRAGKPIVKYAEVQSWFQNRLQNCCPEDSSSDMSKKLPLDPESCVTDEIDEKLQIPKGEKVLDLSELEFEARSSQDGAWYDVDRFLDHRLLDSGESEVLVRYVGFGEEEDEWVTVEKAVRERSVPLDHSECLKVNVGDLVVCFQENEEQARYYDAHVIEIHRRLHDIRGCRCVFLIRYDHDNTEESVRLKRLCCRPYTLGLLPKS